MTWLDNTHGFGYEQQVELTRSVQVAEQSQPNHTSRSKHYRCIIIISYLPFGYPITHRTYLLFQMTNNCSYPMCILPLFSCTEYNCSLTTNGR